MYTIDTKLREIKKQISTNCIDLKIYHLESMKEKNQEKRNGLIQNCKKISTEIGYLNKKKDLINKINK